MNLRSKSRIGRQYLLRRDARDSRDHRWGIPAHLSDPLALPPVVSLRASMPPVLNQLAFGTCYANAAATMVQYYGLRKSVFPDTPSRLFIAWNACAEENTTDEVDGIASIRDVAYSVNKMGFCCETAGPAPWDYTDAHMNKRPDDACFAEATKHTLVSYKVVQHDMHAVKACLANGDPFMFGMAIYPQFESESCAQTGIVETPSWFKRNFRGSIGGHAVVAIGYDDNKQMIEVRNSWGAAWGDHGNFWLPYEYIDNDTLCYDQWMFTGVKHTA